MARRHGRRCPASALSVLRFADALRLPCSRCEGARRIAGFRLQVVRCRTRLGAGRGNFAACRTPIGAGLISEGLVSPRTRPRRGLILCVTIAKTAYPAHRVQALSKRCEPAIRASGAVGAVVRTPRIVLGLRTLSGAHEAYANSEDE